MKFIRRIIIILFTVSLFFILSDIYSEKELSDAHSIYGLTQSSRNLVFSISNKIEDIDVEKYCEDLVGMAKETDVILINRNIDRNQGEKFTYYYYANKPLNQIIDLPLNKHMDSLRYSNDLTDGNRLTILNANLKVTFLPLPQMVDDENQKYFPISAYAADPENLKEFEHQFIEKYDDVIDSIDEMNNHQFDYNRDFRMQITRFFILGIALFMIMSLFQISDNLDTISVMKLHGYGYMEIGFHLLWRILAEILLIELITSVVLVLVRLNPLSQHPLLFLRGYIDALIRVNIALFTVLIVIFGVVNYIRLPKLLKGRNYNNGLLNLAFFAKVMMLFFLIPMIAPLLGSLYTNLSYLPNINRGWRDFETTYYVENLAIQNRFDGYNELKYITGDLDEVFEEHKRVYNYFNNQDQLIYYEPQSLGIADDQNPDEWIPYEGYKVNRKYLEESLLKDVNGSILELDLKNDTVYVLVPESMYSEIKISRNLFSIEEKNPLKLMVIADQEYKDYGLIANRSVSLPSYQKTPYFIVYSDQAFRYNQSITKSSYLIGFESQKKLQEALYSASPDKEYEFLESDAVLTQLKEIAMSNLKNVIVSITPGIAVFIITSLSVLVLYSRANMKKILVHRFFGYSIWASNSDLFTKKLLALIIPTIILYKDLGVTIFPAVAIFLILDVLCWMWSIKTSESMI